MRLLFSSVLLLVLLCCSCNVAVTRPKLPMSIAQEAFEAAKLAGADELAPQEFRLAEMALVQARSAYQRKFFDKAQKLALLSIKYSELAELQALKQTALGAKE